MKEPTKVTKTVIKTVTKTVTSKSPKAAVKTAAKKSPETAVKKVAKKTTPKAPAVMPAFQTGQIWQMENSDVHIGLIGKTLVHYKHFKGGVQRSPVSLAGKIVLEKYLLDNKAVLVKG